MARFLYITHRNTCPDNINKFIEAAQAYRDCLSYAGVPMTDNSFQSKENSFLQIFNQGPSVRSKDCNLYANSINKDENTGHSLKIETNTNEVIISSDICGSRRVWYYFDHKSDIFIASDSQRAIIIYLQSFVPNRQAISWMISGGNLGPLNSWDKRINALPPNGTLVLNKQTFNLKIEVKSLDFATTQENNATLSQELQGLLTKRFKEIKTHNSHIVSLSGGLDSRALLHYFTKAGNAPDSMSWGMKNSNIEPGTDAQVASKVAKYYQSNHEFISLEYDPADFEKIFSAYLQLGEGRIDHINSFTDQQAGYKSLATNGYKGVFRADEAFGWLPVSNEHDTRISLDFNTLSDFSNQKKLEILGLETLLIPEELAKRPDETLAQWRDKVYLNFRIPTILNALHDLIYPFMEVHNPFLQDDIIKLTRKFRDEQRTDKAIFRSLLSEKMKEAGQYATIPSIPEPTSIVSCIKLKPFVLDRLHSSNLRAHFDDQLIDQIESNLTWRDQTYTLNSPRTSTFNSFLPFRIKKLIRNYALGYKISYNRLALRALICADTIKMLEKDSQRTNKKES